MAFGDLEQVLVEERIARLRAEADGWRRRRRARAAKRFAPTRKPAASRPGVPVPIDFSPANGQKEARK